MAWEPHQSLHPPPIREAPHQGSPRTGWHPLRCRIISGRPHCGWHGELPPQPHLCQLERNVHTRGHCAPQPEPEEGLQEPEGAEGAEEGGGGGGEWRAEPVEGGGTCPRLSSAQCAVQPQFDQSGPACACFCAGPAAACHPTAQPDFTFDLCTKELPQWSFSRQHQEPRGITMEQRCFRNW